MRRPLLYPLIALIAGIVIGDITSLPCFLLLSGAALMLLILLISIRNKWNVVAFIFILFFMLIVGIFNIQRHQYLADNHQHIKHKADNGQLTVEGIVVKSEPLPPARNVLVVSSRRILKDHVYLPVSGNIRLTIPADLSFQYGDFIRFHTKIRRITGFKNPGAHNYERFLNRQGISVSGYVSSNADIVLIRHNTADRMKLKLENIRLRLKHLIYANAPSPQREILEAMTLGNQKAIPLSVRDNFAKTGTSHILAISGLHIGMVAAAGFFLIILMLKSSEYLMLRFNIIKIAAAYAILPVVLYALIAGMGTTVLRATLMAVAFLIALLIGKQKDLYNILFGAALVILMITPDALFEISFQLSFSAVLAILYLVPKFKDMALPIPSSAPQCLLVLIRRFYIFVLVSAAATLGTLPIIIFYFNRVSALTLIANLMVVPLLGMITLTFSLVSMLTAVFSNALAGLLIQTAAFFTGIAVEIIERLASLSWSSFILTKPTLVEIILYYGSIFLLAEVITQGKNTNTRGFTARHPSLVKAGFMICLALILADSVHLALKDQYTTDLKITAIDVGQGAATLLQLPRGVNILIDGGGSHDGSFDVGKNVIAPFLYAQRIRTIDIVVLTHPHPDHLQGLIHALNNFNVKEVWWTGLKLPDELNLLWQKTLCAGKFRIKIVSAQSPPENISGVRFQFLWPIQPPDHNNPETSYDAINDSSLVIKITHGKENILMTGDISSEVETSLIASGNKLKSDLLFVPHHGSIHSSSDDFIRAVSCRFAVISAGKNNVFHHPHSVVLDRYKSAGVQIFRTDRDGAISATSDGQTLKTSPSRKLPLLYGDVPE